MDLAAYFEQAKTFNRPGTYDYSKLDSEQGWCAYPATYVYIYSIIEIVGSPVLIRDKNDNDKLMVGNHLRFQLFHAVILTLLTYISAKVYIKAFKA